MTTETRKRDSDVRQKKVSQIWKIKKEVWRLRGEEGLRERGETNSTELVKRGSSK